MVSRAVKTVWPVAGAKAAEGLPVAVQSPAMRRAFSLLETLIALTILGFALVSMVGWLAQSSSFEKQLDRHRVAIRELDAQHEALRGGSPLPGLTGSYPLTAITDLAELEAPRLSMTIKPGPKAGLYEVDLELRYRIANQSFARRLEALTWRP